LLEIALEIMNIMEIKQGTRVRHIISGYHGTVQAKRVYNVMVKWDNTGYTDKHKIKYLVPTGEGC